MLNCIAKMFDRTPYRRNITLEEVGKIPDYEQIIDGLKYSTVNSKLFAYHIENKILGSEGYVLRDNGVYFTGCYKTPKGRFFRYKYEHEYKSDSIDKEIRSLSISEVSQVLSNIYHWYTILIKPEEVIEVEDA